MSFEDVVALYLRVQQHADATLDELDLDTVGSVPWWREHPEVTLGHVLVRVATETHRHAGHADIVRELVDGSAGLRPGATNLPDQDDAEREAHLARLEAAARAAAG